MNFIYRTSYFP